MLGRTPELIVRCKQSFRAMVLLKQTRDNDIDETYKYILLDKLPILIISLKTKQKSYFILGSIPQIVILRRIQL